MPLAQSDLELKQLVAQLSGNLPSLLRSNFEPPTIIAAYNRPLERVHTFLDDLALFEGNARLNQKDVAEASLKAGRATDTGLEKDLEKELAAYDKHEAAERAILAKADRTTQASPEQVQAMIGRLAGLGTDDITMLYSAATDAEKIVIEGVGRVLPRVPSRTKDGVAWTEFLPKKLVEDAQAKRAAIADPAAAARLADITMIKGDLSSIYKVALRIVHDEVARFGAAVREPVFKDPRTGRVMTMPAVR